MNVQLHHLEYTAEQQEIAALLRLERMLDKEWDDRPQQVASAAHAVGCSVAMVPSDDSATEEVPQRMQQLDVAFVLHDGEFGKHLAVHPHAGMN
jgi:hypothetical protein